MTWFMDFLKWIFAQAVFIAVLIAFFLIYLNHYSLKRVESMCGEMQEKLDRLLAPPPKTKRPEDVPDAFQDRIRRILARYTEADALYHITERLRVDDGLARDILEHIKAQGPSVASSDPNPDERA